MGLPIIPEKMPQDFDSRPYTKRIEWWNIFFMAVREAVNYVWKFVNDKFDNEIDKITVNGVVKTLLFKSFTGTTSSGGFSFAHGVTSSKWLFAELSILRTDTAEYYDQSDSGTGLVLKHNATNIMLIGAAGVFNAAAYTVTIGYYE